MALIKCSECGQSVSDKASICPHCGNPLTPKVFCDECGNELSPNDRICPKCGCPAPVINNTGNSVNTNTRSPIIISNSEKEYYYPKQTVFTSMIEAVSREGTLKIGSFDETSGVIRASTKASMGGGWGEIITINIFEVTPESCRVKVHSVPKVASSPWGKHEQNYALIFRLLEYSLKNGH